VTPKGNSLVTQCTDWQDWTNQFLCTAHPLHAFQSARHTKSAHCREAIYIPSNTCSLDLPDKASQTASRLVHHFCTARGRESLYFTVCIKMWL